MAQSSCLLRADSDTIPATDALENRILKKQVLKNYIELLILKETNLVLRELFQLLSTTHIETVEFV